MGTFNGLISDGKLSMDADNLGWGRVDSVNFHISPQEGVLAPDSRSCGEQSTSSGKLRIIALCRERGSGGRKKEKKRQPELARARERGEST